MPLAALLPPDERPATDTAAPRRAIVFCLNGSFLRPLRVLVRSMIETRSLLTAPVIVLTDDRAVADSAFVAGFADRVDVTTADDLRYLRAINASRVPEHFRIGDIPKYTFLKWQIFRIEGFDELIFLDADMIVLKCLDDEGFFRQALSGHDMLGGPQFNAGFRALAAQDYDGFRQIMDNLVEGRLSSASRRLNSGVMRIGPRLLGGEFFDGLVQFARRRALKNEQSYLTEFFKVSDTYRLKLVSARCNFHESHFGRLTEADQRRLLPQIAVMHFAGPNKPWDNPARDSIASELWLKLAARADAATPGAAP